jgi:hypothetical protein
MMQSHGSVLLALPLPPLHMEHVYFSTLVNE